MSGARTREGIKEGERECRWIERFRATSETRHQPYRGSFRTSRCTKLSPKVKTNTNFNSISLFLYLSSQLPPFTHNPPDTPTLPGSLFPETCTIIRSCVLNPVVPASCNFCCYGNKERHKAYRSPGSFHSTSLASFCLLSNLITSRQPLLQCGHINGISIAF